MEITKASFWTAQNTISAKNVVSVNAKRRSAPFFYEWQLFLVTDFFNPSLRGDKWQPFIGKSLGDSWMALKMPA